MKKGLLLLGLVFLATGAKAREFHQQIKAVPIVREAAYWVSEWRDLEIPEGLASFQILLKGSPEAFIQVTDLIGPDGRAYISSNANSDHRLNNYNNPILSNVLSEVRNQAVVPGTGSVIIPNDPHSPSPAAGVWRLRTLSHYQPLQKTVDLEVIGKYPEDLQKSRLPLRVWIAPDSYWSRNPEHVRELLAAAKKIYFTEAGFDLDVLSVQTLARKPSVPMTLPQDTAAIAANLNQADAINAYLLPTMQFQNKPVNGLACIGGPVGALMKQDCFVSMYASDRADEINLDSQAKILVHEIGHYLGLFHTEDTGYYAIGTVHDRLEDTPEQVTGSNMMDPGIHNATPHFSLLQKKMMRLSPALQ